MSQLDPDTPLKYVATDALTFGAHDVHLAAARSASLIQQRE